jgi:hypothetical protein
MSILTRRYSLSAHDSELDADIKALKAIKTRIVGNIHNVFPKDYFKKGSLTKRKIQSNRQLCLYAK